MTSGEDSGDSDDEQSPSATPFSWGLTPSAPAPDEPEQPDKPEQLVEPEQPDEPERPASEPPPTEALTAVDLPTGLMDVADMPTAAISAVDLPTAAMDLPTRRELRMPAAIDSSLEGATEVIGAHPVSTAGPVGESVEHDAVGALFGDEQFVEYEEPLRGVLVPVASGRSRESQAPRPPIPRGQLVAISIGAGLVAALALTALFLGGTKIGESIVPAAVATPIPADTASAAPTVGPLPAGTYAWSELLGGECVEAFDSAWQDEYTVVECAQPHAAQLLLRGTFDDAVSAPFPEADALVARITTLCSTDAVINFGAAQNFSDLELVASFAPNATEWDAGQREYYCFATRSGDDALTESVAQPQAELLVE